MTFRNLFNIRKLEADLTRARRREMEARTAAKAAIEWHEKCIDERHTLEMQVLTHRR